MQMPKLNDSPIIPRRRPTVVKCGAKDFNGLGQSDWQPIRVTDLLHNGEGPGTCGRCGRNDLRFLHIIEHPAKGRLDVGSECARHLCRGYLPEAQEGRLRNLWARRSRWLNRDWRRSWKGNEVLKLLDRARGVARVTIFEDAVEGWRYCVAVGEQAHCSRGCPGFPTADRAKLASFDHLALLLGWDSPTAGEEGSEGA
jgi:hypothetical protein